MEGVEVKRVALFARWPELGRVKTRLSPALPPELALRLYEAMLADALGAVSRSRADESFVYWADAPRDRGPWDEKITPARSRDQTGEDLGARLERAFDDLLKDGPARAVFLGADCPMLDADALRRALEALAEHDLVLGPSHDGGYYLIGLTRTAPSLFRDVAWGTGGVLEQTLDRARGLRLAVSLLPMLDDLDTPEDLVRWLASAAEAGELPSRRTAEMLRELGLLPGRTMLGHAH